MRRCAVALLLALLGIGASPPTVAERDVLAARWAAASHRPIRLLDAHERAVSLPPPNLQTLAERELAVPHRYDFSAPKRTIAPTPPWWIVAWHWLSDRWQELWRALFSRARIGRNGAIAIGDVLIVVVALVLIFVALRLVLEIQRDRRARRGSVTALDAPPDARELYARALSHAQRGEYALAARWLFAATVAALDLHAIVHDDRSATVSEMRRTLRTRDGALVTSFDAIAAAFVAAAYAERPVSEHEWECARDAYGAIDRMVEA